MDSIFTFQQELGTQEATPALTAVQAQDPQDVGNSSVPSDVRSTSQGAATNRRCHTSRTLPQVPDFNNRLVHRRPLHKASALSPDLEPGVLRPVDIFTFFFSTRIMEELAANTNAYAESKGAGTEGSRVWATTSAKELSTFFGILIYMGLFPMPSTADFWSQEQLYPKYPLVNFMTLLRFQQLKRFFHVSHPEADHPHWYSKMEPLSSHLEERFRRYYVPSSNVSVDEMMVRFCGRSAHTIRMKNKPIPEGYKILALCDDGYTYSFLYTSRICPTVGPERVRGLNETSCSVLHLARKLPYARHSFNIFMDNYFSNVPLFLELRKLGIGACGTVRTNSSRFPTALKVRKNERFDWNTTSGVVVENEVLAAFWMDNGPVTMLSTIHELKGNAWYITRHRRRPRETSTNARSVRAVFGNNARANLQIPRIIDDYNHCMNGVDLADQLRSYYCTQLIVRRTWMPLFFWLFDTTIINCYRIHVTQGGHLAHKEFRLQLAWDLMAVVAQADGSMTRRRRQEAEADDQRKKSRRGYLTKSTVDLPETRFSPGAHLPLTLPQGQRHNCILCRYKARHRNSDVQYVKTPWKCEHCDVPLCLTKERNCFREFHNED